MNVGKLKKGKKFTVNGWGDSIVYEVIMPSSENIKICTTRENKTLMAGIGVLAGRDIEGYGKDLIFLPVISEVTPVP